MNNDLLPARMEAIKTRRRVISVVLGFLFLPVAYFSFLLVGFGLAAPGQANLGANVVLFTLASLPFVLLISCIVELVISFGVSTRLRNMIELIFVVLPVMHLALAAALLFL